MRPTEEQLAILEQAEAILRQAGVATVCLDTTSTMVEQGRAVRRVDSFTLGGAVAALCDPKAWEY